MTTQILQQWSQQAMIHRNTEDNGYQTPAPQEAIVARVGSKDSGIPTPCFNQTTKPTVVSSVTGTGQVPPLEQDMPRAGTGKRPDHQLESRDREDRGQASVWQSPGIVKWGTLLRQRQADTTTVMNVPSRETRHTSAMAMREAGAILEPAMPAVTPVKASILQVRCWKINWSRYCLACRDCLKTQQIDSQSGQVPPDKGRVIASKKIGNSSASFEQEAHNPGAAEYQLEVLHPRLGLLLELIRGRNQMGRQYNHRCAAILESNRAI